MSAGAQNVHRVNDERCAGKVRRWDAPEPDVDGVIAEAGEGTGKG